jgi:hypothetical protein
MTDRQQGIQNTEIGIGWKKRDTARKYGTKENKEEGIHNDKQIWKNNLHTTLYQKEKGETISKLTI